MFRVCADNHKVKHKLCFCFIEPGLHQDNTGGAGSPTCLKMSTGGACEDLDMETEEEEDVRSRGMNITKGHVNM